MEEEDTNVEFRILQELDGVDPNATIRLTLIWPFHKWCPFLKGAMIPHL
jgi:hypothetical protein